MYFGSKNALSFCYSKSSSEIVKLPLGKPRSQKARKTGGEAQRWDFRACVWGPEFISSTAERKTAKWRPGTSVPKVRPGHTCLKDRSEYEHQISYCSSKALCLSVSLSHSVVFFFLIMGLHIARASLKHLICPGWHWTSELLASTFPDQDYRETWVTTPW